MAIRVLVDFSRQIIRLMPLAAGLEDRDGHLLMLPAGSGATTARACGLGWRSCP